MQVRLQIDGRVAAGFDALGEIAKADAFNLRGRLLSRFDSAGLRNVHAAVIWI